MAPVHSFNPLRPKVPGGRKPNNFTGQGRVLGSGTKIGKSLSHQKYKKAFVPKMFTVPVVDDDEEEVILPGDLKLSAADKSAIEEAKNHPALKKAKDKEFLTPVTATPSTINAFATQSVTSTEQPRQIMTETTESKPIICKYRNDMQKAKKLIDTGNEGDTLCLCEICRMRRKRAAWLLGLAEKSRAGKRSKK